MKVHTRQSRIIPASPEVLFDHAILDVEVLARTVKPLGPLPGVVGNEMVGGGELERGKIRRVHLTDGTHLDEEIVELERPRLMAYRQLIPFGLPFRLLVRNAGGRYLFAPEDGGTRLTWATWFELTTFLAWPATVALRSLLLHRFMRRWLQAVADDLAAHPPATE